MIKIVYDSQSGLGKKFAEKLSHPAYDISQVPDADCILVTRNVGLGKIPKTTKSFLDDYASLVKGVVINGDRRFGRFYCGAGPKIESRYHLPIIRNIEGEGNDEDVLAVAEYIKELAPSVI